MNNLEQKILNVRNFYQIPKGLRIGQFILDNYINEDIFIIDEEYQNTGLRNFITIKDFYYYPDNKFIELLESKSDELQFQITISEEDIKRYNTFETNIINKENIVKIFKSNYPDIYQLDIIQNIISM